MKKTIGIVFADTMEYGPFLSFAKQKGALEKIRRGNESVSFTLEKGERALEIVAVKCGIGKVNAGAATAFLISDDSADIILNAGLSGAVQRLRREDIIAAESYVECDYDLTAIGYKLGEKPDGQRYLYSADEALLSIALKNPTVKKAKAGSGDIFLTDKAKKELFKTTFGIDSFDMETAAIASVCDKCSVPMLSLRKISDDADDCSTDDYREMNERQELCLTELLCEICEGIFEDERFW